MSSNKEKENKINYYEKSEDIFLLEIKVSNYFLITRCISQIFQHLLSKYIQES